MKYLFPDYYRSFHCIGGQCPDTCCKGWNISIDSNSLKKYKSLTKSLSRKQPDFARKLKKSIDFRRGIFCIEDRSCPFLNANNLCDLYIHTGQDSLCDTCRLYPRHLEEFGNLREISLSLSCPEAAKIILTYPHRPQTRCKTTSHSCPKNQEVDTAVLDWLIQAREVILDIIWGTAPLNVAVSMALAFSHDLQLRHADRRFFDDETFHAERAFEDLNQLARQYLRPDADVHFRNQLQKYLRTFLDSWLMKLLTTYSGLEPVLENWSELMADCRHYLRTAPQASDTLPAFLSSNTLWEKQLLTYFIQVYFLGAIYDDDIFEKMQFAAISWIMVRLMSASLAVSSDIPWIRAAYLYSRQVENSDNNLATLFGAFASQKEFRLFRLLSLLHTE